eukprot:CAMPEP_0118653266 /NCGR_PEP_ID=MMETSP0785-20121206/11744_1 /TAXON_ID=91992 /ORGANISM="Bolidomonas pacifica, Strain CCMP 1866" /LENGTH=280 /DNA_ID=CAMNT_0006545807 /DNA_START=76 /DNA_END=918 /DNA_ORIENTATION=+
MEDAHSIEMNFAGKDQHFMMVCDGHAGDRAAKEIAKLMPQHIKDNYNFDTDVSYPSKLRRKEYAEALFDSFLEVDKKLLKLDGFNNMSEKSGTTVNAVIISEKEIVCANAGDTRCVVSSEKKAKDLSQDHKPNRLDEVSRIEKAGGHVSRGRVNGLHGVSRSLGDFSYKDDGKATDPDNQIVTCRPDVCVYPIKYEKDEFVLICCDGVWDVMGSQEAVDFIHKTLENPEVDTLDKCLIKLLETCLDKGGQDNMTAAIIALPGFCTDHNYFRKKSRMCSIS